MSDDGNRPAAPDFTLACVVMFGVNLTWVLMTIWIVWGLIAAAATGWAVNKVIDRIAAARQ
ncbi:hypothetical protein FIU94_10225 [Sulfitobacter sp. THAF37]|uniref:hypothetical protein n=1 Tax=Sulfitobacter sp. THAF37 TaxID=2587855 RepID=UPI0012684BB6|nr:hypothetical protein [Sulfitobacter sp. THAF37]QFT59201.1 hypothetical protein FIU94_10225 [Sulfitobacter sp. THAF37]